LRESHREKLVSAGKVLYLVIATVAADTFLKLVSGQKIQYARKQFVRYSHPIVSQNQTEPEIQKRPFAFQIEKS